MATEVGKTGPTSKTIGSQVEGVHKNQGDDAGPANGGDGAQSLKTASPTGSLPSELSTDSGEK